MNLRRGFFSLHEKKQTWLTKLLTSLFRRDVLESFDASAYQHSRGIHLFYQLVKNHKAYYFREIFGVHRVHTGGINSMKHGVINSLAVYKCYKELYEQNRDEFTRHMHLKIALGLFKFNLYNRRKGKGFKKNLQI